MILEGKRILVTGVLDRHSIAFAIAEQVQRQGAEVLLTSFGRARRITERAAEQLPEPAEVLELDVTRSEDFDALREELERRWEGLDGAVHSIAFAPPDAIGGDFLATPVASAAKAFEVSAYSLKALAAAVLPLLEARAGEGSPGVVGLDLDAHQAYPFYDWMGVSKAALESVARYLARDLGPRGVRVNLVAAGPLETAAARGIEGFDRLVDDWMRRVPLRWDTKDPSPVAAAAVFLLSDLARAVTGEVLHADGGFHAIGGDLRPTAPGAEG